MHDLEVGIGFPVDRDLPGKGEITSGEFPGGGYAVCLYTGPYSELGTAYDALNEWVMTNGYASTGLVYEMYLDDPATTPPKDLKTQILFKVD
jgi:effector-binding domain-containing protein